jgi:arylsulfatase A-like enzyme
MECRDHEAQEHSFHHGRSDGRANVADLRTVADQVAESLSRLAAQGVVFDAAYCNSPLCAPSRFTLVSGQLPSKIGAYDNAADFPADVPTYAHYLRRLGYRTALSGKMHFCGPDQLHGYERTPDQRHLPGRLRLGGELGRTSAPVVPQHVFGAASRPVRAHQPAGFRRSGVQGPAVPVRPHSRRRRPAVLPDRVDDPPPRPVHHSQGGICTTMPISRCL